MMPIRRYQIRSAAILLLLMASHGLADDRVNAALLRARDFLTSTQEADGAWRSGVHGSFKDGLSLTPLVMTSLSFLRAIDPVDQTAFVKGDRYLIEFSRGDTEGNFPLYTSAIGTWVMAMGDDPMHHAARDVFLDRLRRLQLNVANGWSPADEHFGGWGYHPNPKKQKDGPADPAGEPMANLSATVFAIGALKLARVPANDPALLDAIAFVRRCQNWSDDLARIDPAFDDGGFAFAPGDEAKNKPGAAGVDKFGRRRLHSYGSATADGIRCLLQLGVPIDDPRVTAARGWLISNFDATHNPGEFNDDRLQLANATHYYWLWSAAHACKRLGLVSKDSETTIDWKAAIVNDLLPRQLPNGRWASKYFAGREDDPFVATSFATAALIICTAPDGLGHPATRPAR